MALITLDAFAEVLKKGYLDAKKNKKNDRVRNKNGINSKFNNTFLFMILFL